MKLMRIGLMALAVAGMGLAGCGAADKTEAVDTTRPVNSKCPISGAALHDASPTVSYNGQTVGFCCARCATKFNTMAAAERQAKLDGAM